MNLDYIAGFFDGEGSVSLQFHRMPACKYGYQFLPTISIAQKTRPILEEVQNFLGFGRIYGGHTHRFQIVGHSNIRRFISIFKTRSKLKKQQLELLEEAVGLLHPKPLRGNQLWGGALPKQNVLRLLQLVEEIRDLNGIRGKRTNSVPAVRKEVEEFDEDAYQQRIREGWLRRIAPLIEHRKRQRDTKLPPELIRELYWQRYLSAREIGEQLGCSKRSIFRQMERHSIPRREGSDAIRVHWRLTKGIQHADPKSI